MFTVKFSKNFRILIFVFLFFMVLPDHVFAGNVKNNQPYIIGAGDDLNINVWKEPDLNLESVRVRIDDMITLPLLGDVKAGGNTSMELKKQIEKKLNKFVESPTVTVTVLNSGSKKFYILGEVEETGEYPIIKNLTVLQAFALAGGFTQWASKKEILVFRKTDKIEITIKIDYRDIVKGDFSKNILIQPDDTIIVP